jgi:hypothetical protein
MDVGDTSGKGIALSHLSESRDEVRAVRLIDSTPAPGETFAPRSERRRQD